MKKVFYKKVLVILAGLPLVGKSSLGEVLEKESNFIFLDVDTSRKELYIPDDQNNIRGSEEYEKYTMLKAYSKNHIKTRELLNKDYPVIIAATYSRNIYHKMLYKLCKETDTQLIVFLLKCPDTEIKKRIRLRNLSKVATNIRTFEDYLSVKKRYIKLKNKNLYILDTCHDINILVDEVKKKLVKFKI